MLFDESDFGEGLSAYSVPDLIRVLVIEDDDEDFFILQSVLNTVPWQRYVCHHECDEAAIDQLISEKRFDVCLLDYNLGSSDGLSMLKRLSLHEKMPVILMTSQNEHALDIEAMKLGLMDFVPKDELNRGIVERSIRYALNHFFLKQQLQSLAFVDSLTKLSTRRIFEFEYGKAMERSRRNGTELALFVIDIDDFKMINDTHGHYVGDIALVACARLLQDSVRTYDLVARLGGDEFAVMVEDVTPRRAETIARSIVERLKEGVHAQGELIEMSCSIGVVMVNPAADTASDSYRRADEQLYKAKSSGKAAYAISRPVSVSSSRH